MIEKIIKELGIALIKTQRISVDGIDNIPKKGPVLIVSNHKNWKDVPVIWYEVKKHLGRETYFVGTSQLTDVYECAAMFNKYFSEKTGKNSAFKRAVNLYLAEIITKSIKKWDCLIPVKKEYGKQFNNRRAIVTCKRKLEEGKLVCIFPEYKRCEENKINRFLPGAAKITYDLKKECPNIPIIPMAIKGTEKNFRIYNKIRINIGHILYMHNYRKPEKVIRKKFTKQLEDKVRLLYASSFS